MEDLTKNKKTLALQEEKAIKRKRKDGHPLEREDVMLLIGHRSSMFLLETYDDIAAMVYTSE